MKLINTAIRINMIDPLTLSALFGGIGIAISAAPLGCMLIWRRIAFYGDALAHASLLGVAIGLALNISDNAGIIILCTIFAFGMVWLRHRKMHSSDALLGVLSHTSLAGGIALLSVLGDNNIDIHDYLFGDIMNISNMDITQIYIVSGIIILALIIYWRSFLMMTLSEDMAQAESIPVYKLELFLMIMIALLIAVGVHIMGVLLMSSIMIIPAATARIFSNSPERMAILSIIIAIISVIIGITISELSSISAAPAIVLSAGTQFFLATLFDSIIGRKIMLR